MPAPTIHAFAEKVAIIINGSEGVGRAVALQLALQGCYVIVSYENASESQISALNELMELGTLANAFQFTDAQALIAQVNELFGRIDLLVNCVSKDFEAANQIKTVSEAALELMKFRPKPSIVYVVNEDQTPHFVENLPKNFRQNCVVMKNKKPEIEHELFSLNNFDDVARVVLFLLSSEAKALDKQVLFTN